VGDAPGNASGAFGIDDLAPLADALASLQATRAATSASASASTRTPSSQACRSCSAASRSAIRAGSRSFRRGRVAHALTDALLGAARLADIGALFPSTTALPGAVRWVPTYRHVVAAHVLVNADCVLIGRSPGSRRYGRR
jgi:hypothetical protein